MLKIKKLLARITTSGLIATVLGGFGLKIGAAGLGFLNGIIIARLLGPREFGIYSLLMATTTLVATITTLGLPSLITRQVATYQVREQWGLLKGLVNKSRLWILCSSLLAMALVVTLQRCNVILDNTISPIALIAMLSLISLLAVGQQRAAILRGLHSVILADVPELIVRPVLLIVMLGSYWVLILIQQNNPTLAMLAQWLDSILAMLLQQHDTSVATQVQRIGSTLAMLIQRADSTQVMVMQFIAVGIAFLTGLVFVHRRMPMEARTAQAEAIGKQWLIAALPFFAMTIVGTFESQVALYILSYRADAVQVGLFQAANQMVALVVLGLTAVNMPLQPKIAAAWASGDRVEIQRLASQAVRLSTVIALVAGMVLIVFADSLLKLYGAAYQSAAPALRILAIGQICNAAAGSCGLILVMTGHQNRVLIGQCLALIVNSGAAWLLTVEWGAVGAASGVTLGLVTWNSLLAIMAFRKVKINTSILPFKVKSLAKIN